MELEGKVAVVTGGAGGIGRALAYKFVGEAAAGVVVSDVDGERARAVAEEIGDRAVAFAADVADQAQTAALIAHAEQSCGPVDLFCANAGVAVGVLLEDDEAVWDAAFGV